MDDEKQGVDHEENASEGICGFKDVDDLSQAVLKSVMGAVRSSNDLPVTGDDFDFCSSFSSYQQFLGIQGTRLLQLIQTVMRYHGARGSIAANSELSDVEDRFDVLVDANDQLLERVGTMLDEVSGLRKKEAALVVVTKTPKQTASSGGWNNKITPASDRATGRYKLLTARNIQRPQALFKDRIDNSDRPFVPKIVHKPNALKPLAESMMCNVLDDDPSFCYPHPYQYELDNFTPDPSWLENCKPQLPPPLDATPLTLVTTEQELHKLCQILKTQTEIAVDLEAHSYRSYQGFTCLIQISTRDHDYIIDALALRDCLHALNDSFTDPKILKVFHGADQDVVWLQRDFGVYIVGLFDTHQASRSMAFHRHRLQDLLLHYCNVETNKEYQLEDWRIRPLPEDFLLYARMDTHYLLYIYDCLKNDLLRRSNEQKNVLMSVFQRSTQICAKKYMKPNEKEDRYKDLLLTHRKMFNSQQLAALKGIYLWRDRIARQVDESTGFVLPIQMMLQMAEHLPREPEGILACCSSIPPLVQEYLTDLHQIIKEARSTPIINKKAELHVKPSNILMPALTVTKLQYCPHDTSHIESDENPTVRSQLKTVQAKPEPILSAFQLKPPTVKKTKGMRRADSIKRSFLNPFTIYLPPLEDDEKTLPSTSSSESIVMWKMLPNTVKEEAVSIRNRVAEVLETAPVILFKPTNSEDDETTVRQQLTKQKRQQQLSNEDGGTSKKQKPTHKRLEPVTTTSETFVAYDYSKVDFNQLLKDDGEKSSKMQKKKKREYDPTTSIAEPDMKGVPRKRPLLHTPSNKSLSYVDNKPQMPKIPWPKR